MTAKFIWEFLYLNQIVWSTSESTCKIYNREKTNSALKQVDTTKSFRIATSNYCNAAYFLLDFSPRKRDVFFLKKRDTIPYLLISLHGSSYHLDAVWITIRPTLLWNVRQNNNSNYINSFVLLYYDKMQNIFAIL